MGRVLSGMRQSTPGVGPMNGLRFEPVLGHFDVLMDGTVIGTVHPAIGGWIFYLGANQGVPTSVGLNRSDAVEAGLRVTAGEPSAGLHTETCTR